MKANEETCEICGKKQHYLLVYWPYERDEDGSSPKIIGELPFDTAIYKNGCRIERLVDKILRDCPEAANN